MSNLISVLLTASFAVIVLAVGVGMLLAESREAAKWPTVTADPGPVRHPLLTSITWCTRRRLAILTLLSGGIEVDFPFLRSTLGLIDGNLGRHLEILAAAGYIAIRKNYNGKRLRSWVRVTESGRRALAAEANTLRALLDTHASPTPVVSDCPRRDRDLG
ncbi:transcriptional regulator [Rhodococcus jostii]|uniref:transcriptional regulator n=1 Tax=Rhodococcus jostii TaxID=132919 RepID=UPI003636B977